MKRLLLAVPVAALTLAMTACTHPEHAGAAATVGSDRISTGTLRGMVDRGMAVIPASVTSKPSAVDVERSDLSRLIQLSVLKDMAANLHVTVTAADIDGALIQAAEQGAQTSDATAAKKALEQSAAQQGVDPQTLRVYAEVVAYEDKILQALPTSQSALNSAYQQHISSFEQVHVAHILVRTKAQAESILAQVKADPSKFAALAKKYSTDTGSKDSGGDLGFASPSSYVEPFGSAAWSGKDGTVIGPIKTQYGYHIIKIIAHRATSLADATPQLKASLNSGEFTKRYAAALKANPVAVSPRYGTWSMTDSQEPLGVVVASTKGSLSSPASGQSSAPSPPAGTPSNGASGSASGG